MEQINPKTILWNKCRNHKCVNPNHLTQIDLKRRKLLTNFGIGCDNISTDELYINKRMKDLVNKGRWENNCLLWEGYRNKGGYGKHIEIWKLAHGKVPDGLIIRHKCRNKHCFNLEHLELGTPTDNAMDRKRDGTDTIGEKNGMSVLLEEEAQIIKDTKDFESTKIRANKFNVAESTVRSIDRNNTWSHLKRKDIEHNEQTQKCKSMTKKRRIERSKKDPTHEDYEKFWKRVREKCTTNHNISYDDIACFEFVKKNGSPIRLSFLEKMCLAHVIVWELFHGDCIRGSSKEKSIFRLCGNQYCIEPKHLCIGTAKEHALHMRKQNKASGITEDLARKIWKMKGTTTKKEIANMCNVSIYVVRDIHGKKEHKYIHVYE